MSFLDEWDKIENRILEENPQTIDNLIELFFKMYESDEGINLDDFMFAVESIELEAVDTNNRYKVYHYLRDFLENRVSKIESQKGIKSALTKYPNFQKSEAYIMWNNL